MAEPTFVNSPSPNFDRRDAGATVDMLVLHYTGMTSCQAALDRLVDPASEVSAHYLIDEDGTIYRMVAERYRAWHAGLSSWHGHRNVNARSIGIELVNPGHEFGYRPFPAPQMAALAQLARDILARHAIAAANVVGHSDVAPTRKRDPGELFDWQSLAAQGIGMWPNSDLEPAIERAFEAGPTGAEVENISAALARFGYGIAPSAVFDDHMRVVTEAFQRHFRPDRIDGIFDRDCEGRLRDLLRQTAEIPIDQLDFRA